MGKIQENGIGQQSRKDGNKDGAEEAVKNQLGNPKYIKSSN